MIVFVLKLFSLQILEGYLSTKSASPWNRMSQIDASQNAGASPAVKSVTTLKWLTKHAISLSLSLPPCGSWCRFSIHLHCAFRSSLLPPHKRGPSWKTRKMHLWGKEGGNSFFVFSEKASAIFQSCSCGKADNWLQILKERFQDHELWLATSIFGLLCLVCVLDLWYSNPKSYFRNRERERERELLSTRMRAATVKVSLLVFLAASAMLVQESEASQGLLEAKPCVWKDKVRTFVCKRSSFWASWWIEKN